MLAIVDRSHRRLRGPAKANFRRWPVLGKRVWPNPVARGSYRAEVRFLRSWISRRISWLDRRFAR